MAKPIFIVGLPFIPNYDNFEGSMNIQERLQQQLEDYHVLVYVQHSISEPVFHTYFEKDLTDIQFEELKQIVKDLITTQEE